MNDLYIGLMSGTSADGIDAALVDFSSDMPIIVGTHYTAYSPLIRQQIFALCTPGENEIDRLGELDVILGKAFALAANELILQHALPVSAIKAIGSHGHSIRHRPHQQHRFTLQIGDPNTIAAETGITTVADFRRKDMAYGGQGAPLVPAFHRYLFSSSSCDRIIVNIGGIANATFLPQQKNDFISGFDTGPGNTLLNQWIMQHQNKSHDVAGTWGASGTVQQTLLQNMLKDAYFHLTPPKSTGPEYFNLVWLNKYLQMEAHIAPADVQATLAELTATTILQSIYPYFSAGEILLCGGGVHNNFLLSRLQALVKPSFTLFSTQKYGIHPDWIEAIAFAWLARQTLNREPANVPSVTGAKSAAVLGGIYYANK